MNEMLTDNFLALTKLPRATHHEEAVGKYLLERALSKGLDARMDDIGNVIIDRSAAPGFENAPRTLLQAHMDMVAVGRDGSGWNGETDPVTVVREGNILSAACSSLGGDDGAGIAVIQAILEDEGLACGALRAIFTVDEEQGMSGASFLDPAELDGKYLLNLDWEERGVACCSSAGSDLIRCSFPYKLTPAEGEAFTVTLSGLLGGHSGMDIHKGRGNAIRMLGEMFFRMLEQGFELRIADFESGIASNAIPTRADVTVVVPAGKGEAFLAELDGLFAAQEEKYAPAGEQPALLVLPAEGVTEALGTEETMGLCRFIKSAAVGVFGVTPVDESVVESSASLSEVHFTGRGVYVDVLQRSCVKSYMSKMRTEYGYRALRSGGTMEHRETHALWAGSEESALTELCRRAFAEETGRELRVTAVHAGLECGVWARKNPKLDMLSLGAESKNIHTPAETLDLDSLDELWRVVLRLLKEIGKE